MKHCSLLCVRWWPLVFIGLPILFMLPLLAAKWRFIEADVANNVAIDLQSNGVNWANVETMNRGRHVLITGLPSSQDDIDKARKIAESSAGVDRVTLSANVKAPPQFAELSVIFNEDRIQLNGVLSSQSELESLLAKSQRAFGATNVDNRLTVGSNTAQLPDSSELFTLLAKNAESSDGIKLSIKQNVLNIDGDVKSLRVKSLLEKELNQRYQGQVNSDLRVSAPPPIKRNACQDLVNTLLNNSQINFETGKAIISPNSYDLLNSIKLTAERCPDADFEIAGHTDSSGRLAFNMALSEARAKAVLDHLVNLGLNESQFSSTGYGPNQPIADNSTEIGRAQNRRIEFKLKN